jgi:hypothetical protein
MMKTLVSKGDFTADERKTYLGGAEDAFKAALQESLTKPKEDKNLPGLSRINEFEQLFPNMQGKRGTAEYNNKFLSFTKQYGEAKTPSANVYIGQTPEGGVVVGNTRGPAQVKTIPGPGSTILPKTAPALPTSEVDSLQQIQTMREAVKKVSETFNKSYVGPVAGRAADVQEKTIGGYGQTSKQATFYSALQQANNSLVYLLSGKQINETEYERLKKQLPDRTNSPVVFNARWREFSRTLDSILSNKEKQLKASNYQIAPTESGTQIKTADDYLKKLGNR